MNPNAAHKTCLAAAALLAATCLLPAEAAHPLLTEDTATQGEGKFQIELMVDRTRDHPPGATVRELQTAAVLSYGLADNADLQVGLPTLRQHTHDAGGRHAAGGPLDASLDVKWRFFEREALSLAFKPGITLPTGDADRGFGAGRITWGTLLVLSYEPGPLAFHSHLGYRHNNNAAGQRTSLEHISAALTWKATERLKLVADLSADTNPDRADRGSLRYRILGLIYSPTPALDFDAGLKHGHGRAAMDRAFLFGATFRW
ncbi:MAG: transporter [Rhodocyclales bacterium]|nr:transporter [Rhodocyclales bacterium]